MAATFIFKLGGLDLSSYCRMNPDDKFDVYGAPWLTPAFTETPYADGQPLISTTVGNREQMIPLFLREASKDLLHQLVRSINVAANVRPLAAEWRDDGASASTFFDVAFLRFEPDFNFRRSQHGYAAGILHVWVAGYGHTGTIRVAGTAAGTGVFLSVPMPSIGGDAPALMDTTITAGAVVPTLGRIVAVAPISHPSYSALIPAASLLEAQPGATLVGASGAQGSQYLALPVSPTGGASGIACKVPLQNPTIMGGDNRILAVVESGITGGIGITALDPYGNIMGATAVASMSDGWGIVDLGVCRLPTVGFPTRPELSLLAGALWASGAAGPAIFASPAGLAINEIIVLPDKNLTLILEGRAPPAAAFSRDAFTGLAALAGQNDSLGNLWSAGWNNKDPAQGQGLLSDLGAYAYLNLNATGALRVDSAHLAGILTDSMVISAKPLWPNSHPTGGEIRLVKEAASGVYVQAQMQANASGGFLALAAATNTTLNVLASAAVPTIVFGMKYRLSLQTQGPKAFINLSRDDGGPVFAPGSMAQASIGVASNSALAGAGAPALALTNTPSVSILSVLAYSWAVEPIATGNLQALDSYRFDGPDADTYRTSASGVFAGQKLMSVQRGAFPKAAPSTSSVAVVCAPFDQGTANDLISAAVSVKERFFYAR